MAKSSGEQNKTREKLLKFFNETDVDHNGYLNIKELRNGLRKQGYKLTHSQLKKQFATFDLDGDGRISRDEFMACMGEIPDDVHRTATIRKMFYAFDKNGDGVIDKSEVTEIFKEMRRRKMTPTELDKLMKLMDKDGDGQIQYEEFLEFFQKKYGSS